MGARLPGSRRRAGGGAERLGWREPGALVGSLPLAPGRRGLCRRLCPPATWGVPAALAGPPEMHYINVNFPPSRAPSFNKLSARHCQPNFSHFVSLFSVWGNPVSLGRGGLAAGKVQLCRLADRPTRQAHRREAGTCSAGRLPQARAERHLGGGEPGEKGGSPLFRAAGFWTDGVGERGGALLRPRLPDLGHPSEGTGAPSDPTWGHKLGS